MSPGHLNGEPLTQLSLLTIPMSHATDFPGGKSTNNSYDSYGNDGHLTIYRVFSSRCWQRTSPNLQPGDLILLREDNTNPGPTVVITKIHSSRWHHQCDFIRTQGIIRISHYKNYLLPRV